MNFIDQIFEQKPSQWGLRGDPHLWAELGESFIGETLFQNQDNFEKELNKRFNEIIERSGKRISEDRAWFEKYPQLGMSGGSVCLKWWRETALPLLKNRYKELASV
jgi:hypothetical protein